MISFTSSTSRYLIPQSLLLSLIFKTIAMTTLDIPLSRERELLALDHHASPAQHVQHRLIYTKKDLLLYRRSQPVLARAVTITKQLGIFHFRGTRGGKNNRNKPLWKGPPVPTPITRNEKFLFLNARSLCNKNEELDAVISQHVPTFVAITETWLKPSTPLSFSDSDNYSIHRTDRITKRGGGICFLARNDWQTSDIACTEDHPKGLECNIVRSKLPKMPRFTSALIFYTIYVTPNLTISSQKQAQEHISNSLDMIRHRFPEAKVVLWGDFNHLSLSSLVLSFGLTSCLSQPTRKNAHLDQIWSELTVSDIVVSAPLGNGDHSVVVGQLSLPSLNCTSHPHKDRWIRRHPTSAINACGYRLATTNWDFICQDPSLDSSYDNLRQYLTDTYDHFFPKVKLQNKAPSKRWFNENIRKLLHQKQTAYKKGQQDQLRSLTRQTKQAINQAKQSAYTTNLSNRKKTDTHSWYTQVKKLAGMQPAKATLHNMDLDAINLHFSKQGDHRRGATAQLHEPIPPLLDVPTPLHLFDYEVSSMLSKINTRKAQPLFDIPAYLLQKFHVELATPVAHIFNRSLVEAVIPEGLKTIEISPIPKTKSPKGPDELRPIARVPILLKTLEKFVASLLQIQILSLIDKRQFGGVPKLSCVHYLVTLLHFIHSNLDLKKIVCLLAIDLSKAYDSVSHALLLEKLLHFNIKPQIYNWISAFLTNLSQVVRPSASLKTSSPIRITRGIPQGTSLAPPLFSAFVNDSPQNEDRWEYVDDVTDAAAADTQTEVISKLQSSLNDYSNWVDKNFLAINADKTKAMLIYPNAYSRKHPPPPNLHLNNKPIVFMEEIKILGLTFQNNLLWDRHVDAITNKANSRLHFFRQLAANISEVNDLRLLYTSLIRPVLEYASPAWTTSLSTKGAERIERIQRKTIPLITKQWAASYEQQLTNLSLPTLQEHRNTLTSSFALKLFKDPRFFSLFPSVHHHDGPVTRQSSHLQTVRYRTERMRHSPIPVFSKLLNEMERPPPN